MHQEAIGGRCDSGYVAAGEEFVNNFGNAVSPVPRLA
jgi:hypothetical protein